MTNAELIAVTLDDLLDHEVSLIVYGRAALALGFPNPPEEVANSLDIDIILPFLHIQTIANDNQFWFAQQLLNSQLNSRGLYLTHILQEGQVFLRPEWKSHVRLILSPALRRLKLFHPDAIDLVLTKMMRGEDPQDLDDIRFLISSEGLTEAVMEHAFQLARIPDSEEFRDAFNRALPHVRKMLA